MAYDGGNTTGFPSPATIYLEAVIDLAQILDLRRPSRYPVRVTGGSFPSHGIAERDILVADAAAERAQDCVCIVMMGGETFLAVLKRSGPSWWLIRSNGQELPLSDDTEVWAVVTAIVRQTV